MLARALLLLLALATSSAAAAQADPARYMDATLLAESGLPEPGSTILVGFRFTPRPGWHGYWSNPGDSGIAPTVRWTAPKGVTFGPLLHPAPTLISADGISSFVHEGPHVLLSRMSVDRSIASGTPIPVTADLSWAACTATQCVPLRATLTLQLVAGDGERGPAASALDAAARKLPRAVTGGTLVVDGNRLHLQLPESLSPNASTTRFFPDESGHFDAAAQAAAKRMISVAMKGEALGSLSGVVSDGRRSYRLTFEPAPRPESAEEPKIAEAAATAEAAAPQVPDANNAVIEQASIDAGGQRNEGERGGWLWLLLAIVMPVAAAGWLWSRRRS